ncbi:maturation/adhesion protein [Citrobacter phage NS1]|uniref:Maturation/adhesion protein n=1 Tax=Citrobacter phage NS1 TaxID=2766968 RepID=A0A7G9IRF6_9CAUD
MSTITQFPSGNTQYRIEFDYLARTFVVVTLVNSSNPALNRVLEVGRDYRFLNPTMIEMLVDQSGFDIVRIHRQTGTDLVVDFSNGSVLTASDLTNSELQSIHIAEEGRDQTVDLAKEYADAAGISAGNAKDSEDKARQIASSIKSAGLIGYIARRSFKKGFNITAWNEALLWEADGDYYRWEGALPKNVPAGSTPESSGGISAGAWVNVGDGPGAWVNVGDIFEQKVYVVVITGQSNAQGANSGGPNPASPNVKVWDGTTNTWGVVIIRNYLSPKAPLMVMAGITTLLWLLLIVYLINIGIPKFTLSTILLAGVLLTIGSVLALHPFVTPQSKLKRLHWLHLNYSLPVKLRLITSSGRKGRRCTDWYHYGLPCSVSNLGYTIPFRSVDGESYPLFVMGMSGLHTRYQVWQGQLSYCENQNRNCIYVNSMGLKTQYDVSGTGDYTHWLGDSLWEHGYHRIWYALQERGITHRNQLAPFYGRGTGPWDGQPDAIAMFSSLVSIDSATSQFPTNSVAATGSITWGLNCAADGNYTFAGGHTVTTDNTCNYSAAWGRSISLGPGAQYSASFGRENNVTGNHQFAVGRGHTTSSDGETCLGTYSFYVSEQENKVKLQVGVGSSSSVKKNAITAREDGAVEINVSSSHEPAQKVKWYSMQNLILRYVSKFVVLMV